MASKKNNGKSNGKATRVQTRITRSTGETAIMDDQYRNPVTGEIHDLHEGGKWIPSVVGLVYGDVEPGDAVEMTAKDGRVRTVVVQYVLGKGVTGQNSQAGPGKPFTKFIPVPEPKQDGTKSRGTKSRVEQERWAQQNAVNAAILAELKALRGMK